MKRLPYLFLALLLLPACDQDNGPTSPTDGFDRATMLVHWADQIILPGYRAFTDLTDGLRQQAEIFANQPSLDQLNALRSSWYAAYYQFQRVSMFEVGPAEALRFRNQLNVYPIDEAGITANINTGGYNLELPSTIDQQGFPALEYLLYGLAPTAEGVVDFYQQNAAAANYLQYLSVLAARIDELADEVLAEWEGGYRDTFVSKAGSSADASVDQMANAVMFYYEKALRAGKVGIPAGVFATEPLPDHIEAPYQGTFGKQFLLTALEAYIDFFNGRSHDGLIDGPGFADYLAELDIRKDGAPLGDQINDQFTVAQNAINGLMENFAQQIETDNSRLLAAYDELQRNVVLMKVDMFQALSISVAYVDADGD